MKVIYKQPVTDVLDEIIKEHQDNNTINTIQSIELDEDETIEFLKWSGFSPGDSIDVSRLRYKGQRLKVSRAKWDLKA